MEWKGRYWRSLLMSLVLIGGFACKRNQSSRRTIVFPSEDLRIIITDSSQIVWSDSYRIQNPILPQQAITPDEILYYLLFPRVKGTNQLKLTEQRLVNYKMDTNIIVKSLRADYYLDLAKRQDSPQLRADLYQLALHNYEHSYGSLDDHYLDLLESYGVLLYEDLGELELATLVLERNISLRQKRGDHDLGIVNAYRNSADLEYYKSEYLLALCNIKLAIKIVQEQPHINTNILASCFNEEADYLAELGEYTLAINLLDSIKNLDISKISLNNRILIHTNFAGFFRTCKKYQQAEIEFAKAKLLLKRDSSQYLGVQDQYFDFLIYSKQYKKLSKLIPNHIKIIKDDNYYLSLTYDFLSLAFEGLDMVDSAFYYSNLAYGIQIELNGHSSIPSLEEINTTYDDYIGFSLYTNYFRIKSKYHILKRNSSQLIEDLLIYSRLDSLFEMNLSLGDEESQLHLVDIYASVFVDALEGYYQLHELGILNTERILYFFSQSKSVLLRKKKGQHKSSFNLLNGLQKNDKLLTDAIRVEWKKIRQDYPNYDNYEFLLKCINSKSNLTQKVKNKKLLVDEKTRYKDIQEILVNKNQLLLAYIEYKGKMFGLSTNGDKVTFKKWVLDSLELAQFSQFEQLISNKQNNEINTIRSFEFLANDIYITYVEPLLPRNRSIKDWFVMPAGPLLQIPFDALVDSITPSKSFDDLNYLIYDVRIRYIYDMVDIINKNEKLDLAMKKVLVFGFTDKYTSSLPQKSRYPELPGTIKEIKAIEGLDSSVELNKYIGQNCTKYNFLENAEKANIIHIATHAISNSAVRDMNGVIFRDNLYPVDSNSWMLSSEEISAMNFNAKLVFLSACESGLGRVYNGEGAYNLGRAFLTAGVGQVVQSYWVLDDFSASRIVASFYRHYYEGKPVHSALRLAKLKYLKEWPARGQPFFWSGVN